MEAAIALMSNAIMFAHCLVIIFAYISMFILRKPLLNILFPIVSMAYLLTLILFRQDYDVEGGQISLLAFVCAIVAFCAFKTRIYVTRNGFSFDALMQLGLNEVSYDKESKTVSIKSNYKENIQAINRVYRETKQSSVSLGKIVKEMFNYIWFICLIFHLYYHGREIYNLLAVT